VAINIKLKVNWVYETVAAAAVTDDVAEYKM